MIDLEKHINYWRNSAGEDLDVARELLERKRIRHGLFFAHLALEKLLKAHVYRHTKQVPPKIHTLLRLGDKSGLQFSQEQRKFLARFDRYQIEGRYPGILPAEPSIEMARERFKRAEEMFQWLNNQF